MYIYIYIYIYLIFKPPHHWGANCVSVYINKYIYIWYSIPSIIEMLILSVSVYIYIYIYIYIYLIFKPPHHWRVNCEYINIYIYIYSPHDKFSIRKKCVSFTKDSSSVIKHNMQHYKHLCSISVSDLMYRVTMKREAKM